METFRQHILIIEDELSRVEILRYNLTKEGYRVTVNMDGQDGLEAAEETIPDLILLDWMLPGLSGIEVCRQLRRNKKTREIPVLMLPARSEERDKVRGLDIGADDYITKPYSVKELIAGVRAALRRPTAQFFENNLSGGPLEMDLEKHRVICNGKK